MMSFHSLLGTHFDDVREAVVPEDKDWFMVTGGTSLTLKPDGVPDFDFQVPVLPPPTLRAIRPQPLCICVPVGIRQQYVLHKILLLQVLWARRVAEIILNPTTYL